MVSSGDNWFRTIADVSGWMFLDGCGWFWVFSGSFDWFAVLVAMVKYITQNFEKLHNYGEFL